MLLNILEEHTAKNDPTQSVTGKTLGTGNLGACANKNLLVIHL